MAVISGYDLGLIGGALLEIRDDFGIGDWAAEAIVSAAKFGAFFGTFIGGAAMLHYGRRKAIAVDSLFFIVGPLVMAASAGVA
jgi:MFS family permease